MQEKLWLCLIKSGYFDLNDDNDKNDVNSEKSKHSNEDLNNDYDEMGKEILFSNSFYGGMNPAKYFCCRYASTSRCQKLCEEVFILSYY